MSDNEKNDEAWRKILSGEMREFIQLRGFFRRIPSDPRCKMCNAPFHGLGGRIVRVTLRKKPSRVNPYFCNDCYEWLVTHPGSTELEMTLLFADIRGSTTLAQQMGTGTYSQLINRFYVAATHVFSESNAWIERLVGDQVIGLYLPSMAGKDHARVAIQAAGDLLRAVGYGGAHEPWLPLGVGVHSGLTFMGTVGTDSGMRDLTVLGDTVNTTARLSSVAAAGEILISDAACERAGIDTSGLAARSLLLKGRAEPIGVRVASVNTPVAAHEPHPE